MKRIQVFLIILIIIVASVFSVTTTDNLVLSAYYQKPRPTGSWIKLSVTNTAEERLGTGRSLLLSEDDGIIGTEYKDVIKFQLTGDIGNKVTLSFSFTNFTNGSTSITGKANLAFLKSEIINGNKNYTDTWVIESGSETTLDNGSLTVSGTITRKNIGITGLPSGSSYTRTGTIQLQVDKTSYDVAPENTDYTSTVTVTCTYN